MGTEIQKGVCYMREPDFTNSIKEIDDNIKLDNLESPPKDTVNHPSHYNQGKREVIEEMRLMFGDEDVKAFCKLNAYKYMRRADYKGKKEEDLAKAEWYMDYLDEMEKERMALYAAPKPEPIHVVLDTELDTYVSRNDAVTIDGSGDFFVPVKLPEGTKPV
jgi:hypothetical protein